MTIWARGESMFQYMYRHVLNDVPFIYENIPEIKHRIAKWTKNFKYTIEVKYGISRVVFIFPDYVIKVVYGNGDENDCELEFYHFACSEGYGYLFAEVRQRCIHGIKINIMPRVKDIDINRPELLISNYIDSDERDWLHEYVCDLHAGNYGLNDYGEPIIFDYALNYLEDYENEEAE